MDGGNYKYVQKFVNVMKVEEEGQLGIPVRRWKLSIHINLWEC